MTDAERLAEWLEEKAHNHAQDDIVEWSRMVETAALLRAQSARIAALEDALQWLDYHADNQDMSHRDYRIQGALKARKALGKGSE